MIRWTYGIGTDIVLVGRMQALWARYGMRLARRLLRPEESQGLLEALSQPLYLAKRFAVKEATVKALGTGFRDGISFQDIALGRDDNGRPHLQFSGAIARELMIRQITQHSVSVSDDGGYAVAFVLLGGM